MFILIICGITLACVVGASFAYFSVSGTQDTSNIFTSGCFSVSIENEGNAISLTNTIPASDDDGMTGTPYTFTVSNTCNKAANYQLNLESLNQDSSTLAANYIRVGLSSTGDSDIIKTLSDVTAVTPSLTDSYAAHNLYTGTMEGNTTKTFNLRLWVIESATKDDAAGKTYTSKINLIATSL